MPNTVAVLTPILNGADSLPRFRRTLESQTRAPDEILLLDDGSTDGTADWLQAWAAADPRVLVLSNPENQGRGAGRRRLAEAVRSDFVTWLDVDDLWHPEKLERQERDFLDQNLGADVILCAPHLRLNERTGDAQRIDLPRPYGADEYQRIGRDSLPPVMLQAVFGRRDAFLIDGSFDPAMNWSEDFDFFLRFARSGGQVRPQDSDAPLAFYYHSLVGRDPAQIERAHQYLARKHEGFWPHADWRDHEFRIRALRYICFAYIANDQLEPALSIMSDARRRSPDDPQVQDLLQRCERFLDGRLIREPALYIPHRHERANRAKTFLCARIAGGYVFSLETPGGALDFAVTAPGVATWTLSGPRAELSDAEIENLFLRGVGALEVEARAEGRTVRRRFPLSPLSGGVIALLPN